MLKFKSKSCIINWTSCKNLLYNIIDYWYGNRNCLNVNKLKLKELNNNCYAFGVIGILNLNNFILVCFNIKWNVLKLNFMKQKMRFPEI